MRILRIIARLNVGGPAKHVVWLHEELANHGHECLLVTGTLPPGEQDMTSFATAHGVTPVVIPTMSRELSPADAITIWRLWRLMREFRPDVVHTHTAKAGAAGRIAGLFYRRAKFVHTFHGHVFHSYYSRWKTRFFLAIERMLARFNTDRIVVLSEQQLHEIRDEFHVGSAEQFRIVPLGIDFDDLGAADALVRRRGGSRADAPQGARGRAPLQEDSARSELVVGIVGRIAPIKNHDMFLRVAESLRGRARFVVYGDGADRAALERRAGNVEFAGTLEARDVYKSLDIVALTSRNEGTPLALIEAMVCGKPVISTAVGGVVDLLGEVVERKDGFEIRERGITAATDDDAGFASGLAFLLDDATLRRKLSERGFAYIEKRHSKERLVADILSLYSEILS